MPRPVTLPIDRTPGFLEGRAQKCVALLAKAEDFLDRFETAAWAIYTVLYVAWAYLISSHKQLWFDELVSYSVDHLPNWSQAWRALAMGVDANPPLFHAVNRGLLALLGDTHFVQRVSSVIGFWVMSLCIYLIVRRNSSAAAAWVATLLPLSSSAAYFATEARPYGMALGFASIAVVCWLRSTDGVRGSGWWLAGLNLSLAAAMSSHYYAVFLLVPFVAAELTRSARRMKIDWRIVFTIGLSWWPLLVFFTSGLMSAANQYTGNTNSVSLLLPFGFWEFFLRPAVGSLLMATALVMILGWAVGVKYEFKTPLQNEVIIAVWLCGLPLVVVIAARFITHAFEFRYAVCSLVGAALLFGIIVQWASRAVPGAAIVMFLTLVLPIAIDAVGGRNKPRGRVVEYRWEAATLAHPELPIVFGMPLESVQAWYNAPTPALQKRITCLVDVNEAWKRLRSATADLGVINLRPALPVPYEDYKQFAQRRSPFYFVYNPGIESWVLGKLIDDGARPLLLGNFASDQLYLIDWH